jgi:ketosteroid isomerase-like protein
MTGNTDLDMDIVALEERLTDATRRVDIDALNRIYADDIIFTGVTGVICDKKGIMDEALRGAAARQSPSSAASPAVVAYEKDDLRTVRHGATAVSSFRFSITIRGDGQEVTRRYRSTNVWMKREDQWQVVAAQTAALG